MPHAFKYILHGKLYRKKGKHQSSTHFIQGVFKSHGQDFNRYGLNQTYRIRSFGTDG